jgi:hypothetical protein
MATTQQDIDNSEQLLNLSNKIIDAYNARKKVLNGINQEENDLLAATKKQKSLSEEIAANSEKYLNYQIKSKELSKQLSKAVETKKVFEDKFNKIQSNGLKLSENLKNEFAKANQEKRKLKNLIDAENKNYLNQNVLLDAAKKRLEDLYSKQQAGENVNRLKLLTAKNNLRLVSEEAKVSENVLKNLEKRKTKQEDIAKSSIQVYKNSKEVVANSDKEIILLKENLEIRKRVEKSTGLLGGLAKAATKIPGIGQYLNAPEAIEEMEKLASKIEQAGGKSTSFTNRLKIGLKGANVLAKGFIENITAPEAIFALIISSALKANDEAVKLGKSLGYGVGRAEAFRDSLAGIERSSKNINVTTANLVEAFQQLSQITGFAYEYSADQLTTQVKLTKQVGLTADEAAQVQRYGALNGKTSEETYRSFLKGIVATRNQLKVGIDFKATLAEAAKVSGQLAANLGFNPERIAKAVVTAKALGLTFDQLKSATNSLLDFGTSLENELKAELLTGKQLNLERARAAALAGDQVTLADELAKNIGTAADFTKMNVLQQNALSASMGMTSDQLAETLRKREEAIASGKSLAQINEEEAKQALERQNIQDKFNSAILKLQSLLGNLLAGPVGGLLDSFTTLLGTLLQIAGPVFSLISAALVPINFLFKGIAGFVDLIGEGLKVVLPILGAIGGVLVLLNAKLFANAALDIIKGAWQSLGGIPYIGPALAIGASVAAIGAIKKYTIGDGAFDAPSAGGGHTITTTEGSMFQTSKNDQIAVGPGVVDNLNSNKAINTSIDLTPMVAAINEVRSAVNNLVNRPIYLSIDGKNIGTALVQGSHKVA